MNLSGGIYVKRLINAEKVIGTKQTTRLIQNGKAKLVYIAKDADSRLTEPVKVLAEQKNVEVITVDTMLALGKACGIEVKTTAVGIIGI